MSAFKGIADNKKPQMQSKWGLAGKVHGTKPVDTFRARRAQVYQAFAKTNAPSNVL
jgi:hypothetical protein